MPHLVLDPTEDMQLMQREIFGPILPVRTYRDRQEVADYINAHDRPLAIYPFTRDRELQDFYISRVMSGGVSVNEALLHVGQHDLPFGGVGASGMGHYHAQRGLRHLLEAAPGLLPGALLGDPDAVPAALRRAGDEAAEPAAQAQDLSQRPLRASISAASSVKAPSSSRCASAGGARHAKPATSPSWLLGTRPSGTTAS